ncbi:MAG TPA: hypothetical protein PKH23_01885 [Bacillota bacterium]|nr:hypothetical protein [Bacillota bacterium]
MSFEQMKTISLVLYSGAALMFLLTVITFFMFRIPQVIGFLTGSQERKEVAALRRSGTASVESGGVSRGKRKHGRKPGKDPSSRRDSAGADRLAATEKIRTEELPDISGPRAAASSPVPPAPPPPPAAPAPEFPAEPHMPHAEEAPNAATELLSPVPTAGEDTAIRYLEIQPEFELYFYASSIPVD